MQTKDENTGCMRCIKTKGKFETPTEVASHSYFVTGNDHCLVKCLRYWRTQLLLVRWIISTYTHYHSINSGDEVLSFH